MSRSKALLASAALIASSLTIVVGTAPGLSATDGWDRQGPALSTEKRIPYRFRNCTNLHRRWPHGVGKRHAHDKTTGTPVRNFKRSNKIYKRAMNFNRDLDRDRDTIACERE